MEIWKRFNDKQLTHSMAHYLQAVAGLKQEKGHARVGDIADRLGVSKSGVTSMLRSLSSRGLVTHEPYGCVELTEDGRRLAVQTESNRQVLTMFFTRILRVPEELLNSTGFLLARSLEVKNGGPQPHELTVIKLNNGVTIDQLKAMLTSETPPAVMGTPR